MLIDQGMHCTYLSHDVASVGLFHFIPILALIWMHASRFTPLIFNGKIVFYSNESEDFLVTLSRLRNEIDPLQILRLAEEDEEVPDIKIGFTDEYINKDCRGQTEMLSYINSFNFFVFARKLLHLDIDLYRDFNDFISDAIQKNVDQRNIRSWISIVTFDRGLASAVSHGDIIKDRLTTMITDRNEIKIDLPSYLKDYCVTRLRCWIDNAFLAEEMIPGREYIVEGDAIYPVDFKSTGVTETNKKWGDGLQQFLEMKHGLPHSPLFLITNFLSNIDYFERYGSNIVGVSGTLGNDMDKKFMCDTFSVEFATIPTFKRRKYFELDGVILKNERNWMIVVSRQVETVVASQRAVLVICEDIATAGKIHGFVSKNKTTYHYLHTKSEGCHMNKALKPGDVFFTNESRRSRDGLCN